jgi:exodeoxyribonuclease VII large subunit
MTDLAHAPILLEVPYSDKDRVKSLGGRWNGELKKWFVPAGKDSAPFEEWIFAPIVPKETTALPPVPGGDNAPQMSVAEFIGGVRKVVLGTYDHDVWLVGQVTSLRERKSMVLIELMDSEQSAAAQAAKIDVKAFGSVWSGLIKRFVEQTGQDLVPGTTVRVKVRPEFDPKYHLGARLIDIDPTATIGAFELKLREIRKKLAEEGILAANKNLPAPIDFFSVAVIHPHAASGFADFKADADALESLGLCKFLYVSSTFEGPAAEDGIVSAFRKIAAADAERRFDAVMLIRGGGSKQGLMSLSTEGIARAICGCRIPVITGLGHADDDTLPDEIAWKRCDTPSKSIAFIRDAIRARAEEGKEAFLILRRIAEAAVAEQRAVLERTRDGLLHSAERAIARSSENAESGRTALLSAARDAKTKMAILSGEADALRILVVSEAKNRLNEAAKSSDAAVETISSKAGAALASAKAKIDADRDAIAAAAPRLLDVARENVEKAAADIRRIVPERLEAVSRRVAETAALIEAMGPEATIKRGFCLLVGPDGKAVRTTESLRSLGGGVLRMRDGEIDVVVA